MCKSLIDLERREQAEVVSFEGGQMMCKRLEGMGIRRGKIISRISSQLMKGPVIVSIDGQQTAMGRGMAAKVKVKPEKSGKAENGKAHSVKVETVKAETGNINEATPQKWQ